MDSAHRLYRRFGFIKFLPYEGNEILKEFQVHRVFMEKTLDEPACLPLPGLPLENAASTGASTSGHVQGLPCGPTAN